METHESTRSGDAPSWTARAGRTILALIVVVVTFVYLIPRVASYQEAWSTIRGLAPGDITVIVVVGLWNLATYWFVLVAALPALRLREAAVVNQASTAVANSVPGGGALGVAVTVTLLRSWGFDLASITRMALVTGLWNNFVKLGMPIIALAIAAGTLGGAGDRWPAAVFGVLVLAALVTSVYWFLSSDSFATAIGRALAAVVDRILRLFGRRRKTDWEERARTMRADIRDLLTDRWRALTVTTLVSHLSLFALLLVTIRRLGLDSSVIATTRVFVVFAVVRLASALPVTPGGVGIVELGYAAALTAGLGADHAASAVAAVLLFRFITFALPIPTGAAAYAVWRGAGSWRDIPRGRGGGDGAD